MKEHSYLEQLFIFLSGFGNPPLLSILGFIILWLLPLAYSGFRIDVLIICLVSFFLYIFLLVLFSVLRANKYPKNENQLGILAILENSFTIFFWTLAFFILQTIGIKELILGPTNTVNQHSFDLLNIITIITYMISSIYFGVVYYRKLEYEENFVDFANLPIIRTRYGIIALILFLMIVLFVDQNVGYAIFWVALFYAIQLLLAFLSRNLSFVTFYLLRGGNLNSEF